AREVVDGGNVRSVGAGDNDLVHAVDPGIDEVDDLLALRRDREIRHDDVTLAGEECGQQLVAGERDELHVELQGTAAEACVQLLFQQLALVVRGAARRAAVDEEQRPAVGGQHANHAALDHAGQIPGPRFDDVGQRKSQAAFVRGGLRGDDDHRQG